jgi:hypothetical protein
LHASRWYNFHVRASYFTWTIIAAPDHGRCDQILVLRGTIHTEKPGLKVKRETLDKAQAQRPWQCDGGARNSGVDVMLADRVLSRT